jgi:YVTN family beta-propeller protein
MIRRTTFTLGALLAALVATSGEAAAQGALAVRDRAGETLLFDVISLDLIRGLPLSGGPHDVTVSPDGRYAYVVGKPSAVAVVDLWRRSLASVIELGDFSPTHGLRLNRKGSRLWVTAAEDGAVLELDAKSGTMLMVWRTGRELNHRVDVTPDDRKLYIANILDDVVTVIDRQKVSTWPIATGTGPADVSVSPNGREVWVANSGSHTISVLSVRRDRKIDDFFAGALRPVRLRFNPSGSEVWVLHRSSPEVSVFDVRTRQQVASIALPSVPTDILFSNDGIRAFLSVPTGVVAVDTRTREVVRTFSKPRRVRSTSAELRRGH